MTAKLFISLCHIMLTIKNLIHEYLYFSKNHWNKLGMENYKAIYQYIQL